jgi:glycine cleavage system H lipoate-binding protein
MAAKRWTKKKSGSRMNCPFLRETGVKFCHAAPVRKLIPLAQAGRAEEKCSSGAYRDCPVYRASAEAGKGASCPHLAESLMQYCGAAPVSRFVPYSESVLSRCGNGGFWYCELYLAMAHPDLDEEMVEGTPMPSWLRYSANHMWLDVGDDGQCHAGIDAFLSRALGPVQRVSYVWTTGEHRPSAIVTAGGLDLEIVFPNPLRIGGCNLYLRANPGRLASDPYTAGWLFEGTVLAGTTDGLREGTPARTWMEREHQRMNQFLQEEAASGAPADGGTFAPGIIGRLTREQAAALFHEFFSPWAERGKR